MKIVINSFFFRVDWHRVLSRPPRLYCFPSKIFNLVASQCCYLGCFESAGSGAYHPHLFGCDPLLTYRNWVSLPALRVNRTSNRHPFSKSGCTYCMIYTGDDFFKPPIFGLFAASGDRQSRPYPWKPDPLFHLE